MDCVKELGCAIIEEAIKECRSEFSSKTDKEDAIEFITSDRLDVLIAQYGLNLNADYIRRALNVKATKRLTRTYA